MTLNAALAEDVQENTSAVVAGDYSTKDIVLDHNGEEAVTIASTSKLMTYLVVRDEIFKGNGSLHDKIVIDAEVDDTGGSTFLLSEGETVEVKTLLDAIMLVSGNDACLALAKHFGETEDGFVKLMNEKAKELKFLKTKFYTASGLPDEAGNENVMTAKELYTLSSHIIEKYPDILETTKKEKLTVADRNFSDYNTNPLIGTVQEVDGLKTGFTDSAGRCLIATAKQKDGNRVIAVLMGADSEQARKEKSETLMKDLLNDYKVNTLYNPHKAVGERAIGKSQHQRISLYPKEEVKVFLEKNSSIPKQRITIKENLNFPLVPGDSVGTLKLEYGLMEKEIDLTVREEITEFKLFRIGVSNYLKSLV